MGYKSVVENREWFRVGDLKIESGSVMISDPCYKDKTWCQSKQDNVKNGKWDGFVEMGKCNGWGRRVLTLMAVHQDFREKMKNKRWYPIKADIGVDSGQMSIVDYQHYSKVPGDYGGEDGQLYGDICKITLDTELSSGIIPGQIGIVSSSGFGDGGYTAYFQKDNNKKMAFKVIFIVE